MAVRSQLLSAPKPKELMPVIEHLGGLQMDPTASIARAEQLVLWSRLGAYDVADLYRALYQERTLFEYWAYILPQSSYPIHVAAIRRYARGVGDRSKRRLEWVAANADFRRYIIAEIRRRGPLRSRDLDDRSDVTHHSYGWTDGKNLSPMLETLWAQGEITIVARDGQERVWDLASRRYPKLAKRIPEREVARTIIERQLRARSPSRIRQFGWAMDDVRPAGWERAMKDLAGEGIVVPVEISSLDGIWYAHRDALAKGFKPRTTFLAPFDRLIKNRERTEQLFGFFYRIEIYVPPAKRQFGYYVLPILHGERLVGRIDPVFDRKTKRLEVKGVWAEPGAPAGAGPGIAAAIADLARWVGAEEVYFSKKPAPVWRDALKVVSVPSSPGRSRAAGPRPTASPAAPRRRPGSRSKGASP